MTQKKQHGPFDAALQRGLERASRAPGEACPDAEVLAACFEQTLERSEHARWERHFAACTRCQAQLALLARIEPAEERKLAEPAAAWWRWRWLAPAAAALGVVALWVAIRPSVPSIDGPIPPVATRQQPAPATPAPSEADTLAKTQPPPAEPAPGARADQESAPLGLKKEEKSKLAAANEAASLEARKQTAAAPERNLADASARDEIAKADAQKQQGKTREEVAQRPMATPAERAALESKRPDQPVDRVAGQAVQRGAEPAAPAAVVSAPEGATTLSRSFAASPTFVVTVPSPAPGQMTMRARSAIETPDSAIAWRAGAGGRIEKTTDKGRTWAPQDSPTQKDLLAGVCASERICWLVGREGTVLRTTDGEKWEVISAPDKADLVAVIATSERNALVTTADNRRFVTDDAGKTWRPL